MDINKDVIKLLFTVRDCHSLVSDMGGGGSKIAIFGMTYFLHGPKVESEAYFLLKCPVLRHLRKIHLTPITNYIPGFDFLSENFKLTALLVGIRYEICKFVADATELGNFLVSEPKTIG